MKTAIIKWDESMAVRCLARCQEDYAQTAYLLRGVDSNKAFKGKAYSEKEKANTEKENLEKENLEKENTEKVILEIVNTEKAIPEETMSLNIAAGEWDDFQYALSKTLKNNHKRNHR